MKQLPATRVSERMIHAGFIVKDREAADRFYRDILGFQLQWFGGMRDDRTDWVSMRVPEGTDWLEYMLNVNNPTPRTRGVMNHLALGVPSTEQGYKTVTERGLNAEKPKIGRDGKWQLNLYDPNLTRAELMEPRPVQTPCCSPILLANEAILLRPDAPGAPHPPEKVEERGTAALQDRAISNVSQPSITFYPADPALANGTSIIVCPGGGYGHLAIDKEGHDVARWLQSIGVSAFVLKYRLPGAENMRPAMGDVKQAGTAAKVAIEDARDAILMIRANAAKFQIKPNAVGVMGFSAGGHLAAMMGLTAVPEWRPDFLVLVYPAIPKNLEIPAGMPPVFLAHADDDRLSAGDNSVRFYLDLKKAKVPAEMHIYSSGGHGFGTRKTSATSAAWTTSFRAWLEELRHRKS